MAAEELGSESTPNGYQAIDKSLPQYRLLRQRLLTDEQIDESDLPFDFKGKPFSVPVIRGFEDVLDGERLGGGRFYNTSGNALQILAVLGTSTHALFSDIKALDQYTAPELIKILREKQVLRGMKIVDLGAGGSYFARAAQSLGASVITVDAQAEKPYEGLIQIQADLNSDDIAEKILTAAGGQVDFLTEHIISPIPYQKIAAPKTVTVLAIAQRVLRKGGILFSDIVSPPVTPTIYKKR